MNETFTPEEQYENYLVNLQIAQAVAQYIQTILLLLQEEKIDAQDAAKFLTIWE